jgi:hypothetical protein
MTNVATTILEMVSRAVASTQKVPTTSETCPYTVIDTSILLTVHKVLLCEVVQMHSSEYIVYSMELCSQPHQLQ